MQQILSKLKRESRRWLDLIAEEEEAISSYRLQDVETLLEKKELSYKNFEKNVSQLLKKSEDQLGEKPSSLTQLEGLLLAANLTDLAAKVADLRREWQDLQESLGRNRYMLQRLLVNHQRSCEFWLRLLEEEQAAYNKLGNIKSSAGGQLLRAKV